MQAFLFFFFLTTAPWSLTANVQKFRFYCQPFNGAVLDFAARDAADADTFLSCGQQSSVMELAQVL